MYAHDIVQFHMIENMTAEWPLWFEKSTPFYATVRRAVAEKGYVPVGLRGKERNQRFAFELPLEAIDAVIQPWSLIKKPSFREEEIAHYPAYQAYQQALKILQGVKWGVGGSLGFELATGHPTVKPTSDFDLLIYANEPAELPLAVIQQHIAYFQKVDTQVISLKGGFSLKEYLQNPEKKLLMKTISGPILTDELW